MRSFSLFILQDAPTDGGASQRKLALLGIATKSSLGRPLGDVEACNSVSVRFVAAFCASEVDVAFPVLFACVPTPWAGLACIAGFDFLDNHALSFTDAFQGMSEQAVGGCG